MYLDDIKLAGKKQNIDPMWKVLVKEVVWTSQHHSLTMFGVALNDKAKRA